MPRYAVPLVKEMTEYEWATVEVEAASEEEAVELAIAIAEADESGLMGEAIEWNDHGSSYGGHSISRTPNEPVILLDEGDDDE